MALKIVKGDIFDPKFEKVDRIVIHGCNAQGVMASGIAKTIREKYPEVFEDYIYHKKFRGLNLGDCIVTNISRNFGIISIISQEFYGRDKQRVYVSYQALEHGLKTVARRAKSLQAIRDKIVEVHLPFIGGGLANGDREYLLEAFTTIFADVEATLFIKD